MLGFILIDKPEGITSFSAVSKIRKLTGCRQCGHTGTLDPMATGVLVVATGKCTRFIELLPSSDKSYEASFLLGKKTDTLDITGTVIAESNVRSEKEDVEDALSFFRGEITQVPPMYSALKVDGKRLYDLAREGKVIEREGRDVTIHELSLVEYNETTHEGKLIVECSSGTYVRTLIDDLGEKLGCHAVMTALRRMSANGVSIDRCRSFEELEDLKESGRLYEAIASPQELLSYPSVSVTEAQSRRFSNGGELDLDRLNGRFSDGLYCVVSPENGFLGIGRAVNEKNVLFPVKVIGNN